MYVYITVVYIDFILCLENMLCKNIYIMKKNISSKNLSVPIKNMTTFCICLYLLVYQVQKVAKKMMPSA